MEGGHGNKKRNRGQKEVAVGSGSWGRLGSLSMGSALSFFQKRGQPIGCGVMHVFAFEEYEECEIQRWCVIPCKILVCQQLGISVCIVGFRFD